MDNGAPTPPIDEEDAGYEKYLNGPLGTYINTGLDDPRLDRDAPAAAAPRGEGPQLAPDRGSRLPGWGDDAGP